MRFIITEEQHDRVINDPSRMWVRRNYDLVLEELEETFGLTKDDICRYDTYEDFEPYFFAVLMDCLHEYYMDIDNIVYRGIEPELIDLFYVDCTEFYFKYKERC
jgi:hypothetical protein